MSPTDIDLIRRAAAMQQAVNDAGMGPKCPVSATVKTAGFRGETLLFRCDRERGHEGQHHGAQPNQSEMFWGPTG